MLSQWMKQRRYRQSVQALINSPLADNYTPPALDNEQPFLQTEFLALDLETTGLNPKADAILSMGWTTITNGRIQLGQSQHHFIRHTTAIPDTSVAIHHITEQEAANGQPIADILPLLLQQLSGKVLVAHFADIEVGFLQRACQQLYGVKLPLLVVDTLQLAYHLKYQNAVHVPQDALNLFNLRAQYDLPRYKAHNALADAVAAAELLLVFAETLGGIEKTTCSQLRITPLG